MGQGCPEALPLLRPGPVIDARDSRASARDRLYDEVPNRASLHKSVNFLIPYCDGITKHQEWVNSKVALDRQRAQGGEIGANFNPRNAVPALDLASYFDPAVKPLVLKLVSAAHDLQPGNPCSMRRGAAQQWFPNEHSYRT